LSCRVRALLLRFCISCSLMIPSLGYSTSSVDQWDTIHGENKQVVYLSPLGPDVEGEEYPFSLLKLALSYSDKPIQAELSKHVMLQRRAFAQMSQGKFFDVVATMTSIEREKDFLPIRFPILKGLIGWRLPLINSSDPDIFKSVTDLQGMQEFIAGQMHDWPDIPILKSNGLQVYPGSNYDGLFKMLSRSRIDYFPRSIAEIWIELGMNQDKTIMVDTNILLYYPTAYYFFVRKDNEALAEEIEKGLEAALKDGSFDKLFNQYYRTAMERSNIKDRKVFVLKNSFLPEKTPLSRKELWLSLPQ
jgi:hypothetical protein